MKLHAIEIHHFKGLEAVTIPDCGELNALVGKNNSGKSSVLHAIDMAGLALSVRNWNLFQPKIEVKDLFTDVGEFSIGLRYSDGSSLIVTATPQYGPTFNPEPTENQKFRSVLILPDVGSGMLQRVHRTPRYVIEQIEQRNYAAINSLDILYAIKFYAYREERGFSRRTYTAILDEIKRYFPEIEDVESDRTETDTATLVYKELGRKLDILYSGTGLKHFLDVLLKITVSGADIVLLDEPELGLHPDLQRRFIEYLHQLADEKDVQFFMATHSPVLLNYADIMSYYRIINIRGKREALPVPNDAIHTLLSDLGIRPSDVFNKDICVLVEGATDVVFFEHIVHELYSHEFADVAIGVIQYGGSAAEGIVSGAIDVANITPAQKYTLWIRDRDAPPDEEPSENSTKFVNALKEHGLEAHIWEKREIEYYYPEEVMVAAQQGDEAREQAVRKILSGGQKEKFRDAAARDNVCVPTGKYLRKLLKKHLTDKSLLDQEIRTLIDTTLLTWKKEILGER